MDKSKKFVDLRLLTKISIFLTIFILISFILGYIKESITVLSFKEVYNYSILADIGAILLILIILKLLKVKVFDITKLTMKNILRISIVSILVSIVYIFLLKTYFSDFGYTLLEYNKQISIVVIFISFVIITPIFDSLFCKYIVINLFSEKYIYIGVILSSIFSTGMYVSNSNIDLVLYLFVSLFLGSIYAIYRSIELTILSQILINFSLFIVIFI